MSDKDKGLTLSTPGLKVNGAPMPLYTSIDIKEAFGYYYLSIDGTTLLKTNCKKKAEALRSVITSLFEVHELHTKGTGTIAFASESAIEKLMEVVNAG